MLQQTTVAAVTPYFQRWMKKFPTCPDLARAEESEVLALWQGLGYYSRARNLHAAAKAVSGRNFPRVYDELRALPGVGEYTANAILAFAYDIPAPALDANIIRVIARLFDIHAPMDTADGRSQAREKLQRLLPSKNGREFVSALMELGALICRAGKPDCPLCPVKRFCAAAQPEKLPVKTPKPAVQAHTEHAAWISDGKTVLLQQSQGRRWTNLWRLPPLKAPPLTKPMTVLTYGIVRERVSLGVYETRADDLSTSDEPRRSVALLTLENVAVPSPHRRAIARILRQSHS